MIIKEKRVPLWKKGTICSNSSPGALFWYPFFSECIDLILSGHSLTLTPWPQTGMILTTTWKVIPFFLWKNPYTNRPINSKKMISLLIPFHINWMISCIVVLPLFMLNVLFQIESFWKKLRILVKNWILMQNYCLLFTWLIPFSQYILVATISIFHS